MCEGIVVLIGAVLIVKGIMWMRANNHWNW